MKSYILGIDQSTQGTKVLLFDDTGTICYKAAKSHKQYIDEKGWVEHDPDEIWRRLKDLVRDMLDKTDIDARNIKLSASVISVKRRWPGIVRPESPSIGPSSGSVRGARRFVKNFAAKALTL